MTYHNQPTPSRRRRRGFALILACMTMGLLTLIAGLCIEAGSVSYKRMVMQDASDAAARAGATAVGKGRDEAFWAAYNVLVQNASVNNVDARGASVSIDYGVWSLEDEAFTPLGSNRSDADAVRVNVTLAVRPVFVGGDVMATTLQTRSAIARRPTLVLVVGDAKKIGQNDAEMLRRMKGWGVPTKLLSDEKVQASLFQTEDVVMISSSAQSSVLAGKLKGAPCAVICCEVYNWNELGIGSTYGEEIKSNKAADKRGADDDYMTIRDLPETFGFAGRRKIYDGDGRMSWCKPRNDVTKLATWAGDSSKTVAFYYEKGSKLDDGTVAPGFRAGLFMRTEEAYADKWTYSSYTWDCFDAMFAKCLPYVDNRVHLTK